MALALARKYRPKTFADVAVQSHVSATLQGAIARGRVAHGYLLCGPRGVGKTTLARVLAMALNCERRQRGAEASGEPCGECESCRRIWSGSASLDVVEIDAASNRGVDDARELRERAMYAPSGDDRYKVYIVDEAHMLTREAWNALLKILEEPPPRVVFVFATTEPQKIAQAAAPVLSRLQRFDLKRIGTGEIRERLRAVLVAEGVAADPDALATIARAADGSMRDALSLTDQILSTGDGRVTSASVRDALGLVPEEYVALLDVLAERRAADVFPFIARLADAGIDFATFLGGFGDMVRAQLTIALGGEATEVSDSARMALAERRGRVAAADLLRMLSALVELEPRFKKSGQQQLLIETMLVRLALQDRAVDVEQLLRVMGGTGGGPDEGKGGSGSGGGGGGSGERDVSRTPDRVADTSTRRSAAPTPSLPPPSRTGESQDAAAPRATRPSVVPPPGSGPTALAQPAPRPVPPATSASTLPPLDANRVAEIWEQLAAQLREAGRSLVATALEHASPATVTARGDLTIALDEPNEFYAKAIENGAGEIVAALRRWFSPVERVLVKDDGRAATAPPKRLTDEMVRAQTLETLKKKDPILAAAIEVLDLEVVD
jgi:DNA polymerase-3 subunit gamma/tau